LFPARTVVIININGFQQVFLGSNANSLVFSKHEFRRLAAFKIQLNQLATHSQFESLKPVDRQAEVRQTILRREVK
jgi:hypothetical protein